jgi:hypothetical protein
MPSHSARDPSPLWSPSLHLNLTHPHQPSYTLSTTSPLLAVLPRICSSPVARLSRASTPGEKNSGKPEQAPGGHNRPLVPRWAPRLTILILYINTITKVELEFCLIIHSRFYSLLQFLPLSSLPSPTLLIIYLDHSSLPLTLYFLLLEFWPTKLIIQRTFHILSTATPPFYSQSWETTIPRWERKRQQ